MNLTKGLFGNWELIGKLLKSEKEDMMKGGNEEEKLMGPLFPRLHIKDAEKGGPKAPPRNKMALYEQFSVPSQRFPSGSPSILPLPSSNNGSSVPPTPSSHVSSRICCGLSLVCEFTYQIVCVLTKKKKKKLSFKAVYGGSDDCVVSVLC